MVTSVMDNSHTSSPSAFFSWHGESAYSFMEYITRYGQHFDGCHFRAMHFVNDLPPLYDLQSERYCDTVRMGIGFIACSTVLANPKLGALRA